MGKVAIIGVGQSTFVRSYPGSIRELVFEGFKEAMQDAQMSTSDIDASVICSAPEYDKQRSPAGVFAEYLGLNPQPTFYVETLCSSSSTLIATRSFFPCRNTSQTLHRCPARISRTS